MTVIWPFLLMSLQLIFSGCQNSSSPKPHSTGTSEQPNIIQESNTIATRFEAPSGFERTREDSNSFGAYLRKLPLFPAGSVVKYYNGEEKQNHQVYAAVINLPIGKKIFISVLMPLCA